MGIYFDDKHPVNYDDVDAVRGMDIIICTSADNNDQGLALLKKFNFPFRK